MRGFSAFHLFLVACRDLLYLFHAMRKYHDKSWLLHHVITHMLVLTGHHDHSLLARDALGHVVLIVAPVHLSCLQCGQALGPAALVGVLNELVDNGGRAATLYQGALDHSLEHSIWGRDHTSPASHSCWLQGAHPPRGERWSLQPIPFLCIGLFS